MALLQVQYYSAALQKQSAMVVVAPEAREAPFQVVYLLHGLSDDQSIWQRRTSIERYAERYGLMIVMPDGGRSFYCNLPQGLGNYEQHLLDTVCYIDRLFPTVKDPSGRGIGGLSMGGYGAMKLGLKFPEMFCSVAAHSGALDLAALEGGDFPECRLLTEPLDAGNDCFALAAQTGAKPAIRFDCGTDDFLLEQNRRFHAHLTTLNIAHVYEEFSGGHSWEYWDEHIDTALRFHRQNFIQAAKGVKR